jgi:SAM-dependent methyltransferase
MTRMPVASREEVQRFLDETRFTGYVSVPLPHGLSVPGEPRAHAADAIFEGGLEGKSVLDVGTYSGSYPIEALRGGARRAVGVEMDPERRRVAQRIAELHGNAYEIVEGRAEEIDFAERFDRVLFLNVLHHLVDPAAALRNLARLSRDLVVVEFSLPSEPALLACLDGDERPPGFARRLRARAYALLLDALPGSLPLMAVGPRVYHRTFYFTPAAFRNLFVVQLGLFSEVRFRRGVTGRHRVLAYCRVPAAR